MRLALLLASLLAAPQEDPARILQDLEKALAEPGGVTAVLSARATQGEPYLGSLKFGEGNRFRLSRGTKERPDESSLTCDGSTAVKQSSWNYNSFPAKPGIRDRVRSGFVRAGALALLGSADIVDDRHVYLAQEEAGELEISDLKAGPEGKGWKSLTYTLKVPVLKNFITTQMQLRYDPLNRQLLQRDSTQAGRTAREEYSGWKFKVEFPEADFKLPPPPRFAAALRGKITLKGMVRDHGMSLGCVGVDQVSCPWGVGPDISLPPLDIKKLSWDPRTGMAYGFKEIPPGRHLAYLSWGERYIDWRWIQVGDEARATLPELHFTIDPAATGSVEVAVANPAIKEVMFVPADDEGKVPKWSPRLMGKALTAAVKDGKAVFKGMRPGRYVFYAPETEWVFDGFDKASDGEGRTIYIYYPPKSVMDAPADPPRVQVAAEVRAKAVTKVELK